MVIKTTTNTHDTAAAGNLGATRPAPNQSIARLNSASGLVDAADNSNGPAASMRLETRIQRITAALTAVRAAIKQRAADRSATGARRSRTNFTSEQRTVSRENLSAASSRIQSADALKKPTQFARSNILPLSHTATPAQSNPRRQSAPRR